jgi:ankyrin repeat protein
MHNEFLHACETGNLAEAQRLVTEVCIVYRNKVLIDGILFHNATDDILKLLIDNGADINKKNEFGVSFFLLECQKGNTATIKKFIDHGVDVNTTNSEGSGALHKSVISKNIEAVKLVLAANGLKIRMKDRYGKTALLYAAEDAVLERGNPSVFDLIFNASVKANIKKIDKTAIEILKESDRLDIKLYLLKNGLLKLSKINTTQLLMRACEEQYSDLVLYFENKGEDFFKEHFFKEHKNDSAVEILKRSGILPDKLNATKEKYVLSTELDDHETDNKASFGL